MENTTIHDVRIIELPRINDRRGNLSVIEGSTIPFQINRVYYLYDIPSNARRGGHAHIAQQELLVALSGSFDVVVNDGLQKHTYTLNNPGKGLLIVQGIWRELKHFSAGAVCLVVSSDIFSENDYIRNIKDFREYKRNSGE
ncbi:hypothetical protein CHU92_13990 [Flavobacterium cyanobacteriorum]|uniref:Sugar 3,4-ketoisomerase QdtA cupin domain-containing protein n=1 Tax=Flavobacterium cyanobacteriorum TaxID=2022802 RepID=A0A255YUV5_9FLAO|nr:FdtA/QdtA family cupin domain-containing protein [Flavobacterium cyanobacteriorum]OYQ33026.1 hypothetical protein CHU92_13990 [Flavobacterium cyanobacteriorum]